MCKMALIIGSDKPLANFESAMFRSWRGNSDGVGVLYRDSPIKDKKSSPWHLEKTPKTIDFKSLGTTYDRLLTHFRTATCGTGQHPFICEDTEFGKEWLLTHNGMISNHREVREKLEKKGHKFSTDIDSECLVHIWGEIDPKGKTLMERAKSYAESAHKDYHVYGSANVILYNSSTDEWIALCDGSIEIARAKNKIFIMASDLTWINHSALEAIKAESWKMESRAISTGKGIAGDISTAHNSWDTSYYSSEGISRGRDLYFYDSNYGSDYGLDYGGNWSSGTSGRVNNSGIDPVAFRDGSWVNAFNSKPLTWEVVVKSLKERAQFGEESFLADQWTLLIRDDETPLWLATKEASKIIPLSKGEIIAETPIYLQYHWKSLGGVSGWVAKADAKVNWTKMKLKHYLIDPQETNLTTILPCDCSHSKMTHEQGIYSCDSRGCPCIRFCPSEMLAKLLKEDHQCTCTHWAGEHYNMIDVCSVKSCECNEFEDARGKEFKPKPIDDTKADKRAGEPLSIVPRACNCKEGVTKDGKYIIGDICKFHWIKGYRFWFQGKLWLYNQAIVEKLRKQAVAA